MINARMALVTSDEKFEEIYKPQIGFIEEKILEVVHQGFRGVNIKATDDWVGEDDQETLSLITCFRERGFTVDIIKDNLGNMSMWSDSCDSIYISWG